MGQLGLLLWKNFVLQKRRPIGIAVEIVLPILFMALLALLRVQTSDKRECTGDECNEKWTRFRPQENWPLAFIANLSNIPFGQPLFVAYSPNTSALVNSTMSRAQEMIREESTNTTTDFPLFPGTRLPVPITPLHFFGFETKDQMVDYLVTLENEAEDEDRKSPFFAGISFDEDISSSSPVLRYVIHMDATPRVSEGRYSDSDQQVSTKSEAWLTKLTFPGFIRQGPRAKDDPFGGQPFYFYNAFLLLQHAVDRSLMLSLNHSLSPEDIPSVGMRRFPYPEYLENKFIPAVQFGLPLLLLLAYIYTALTLVRNIVLEKERRLKESMKMMGLSGGTHWLAWFVFTYIVMVCSIIVSVMVLHFGRVLEYSDASTILVFFLAFAFSSIMLCFLVSCFFQRAVWGAAGGGIIWLLNYSPYFFVQQQYDSLSFGAKLGTSLFSNVAMAYGAQLIGAFEGQGEGLQWNNFNHGTSVDDTFTFGHVLGMLIFDGVLYGVLAWYIEGVFPGKYGIPRPWYFPFQPSYWSGGSFSGRNKAVPTETMPLRENKSQDSRFFEAEPEDVPAGVRVLRIRKVFNCENGEKVAVNNVSLNMYDGQITVLLGHNGAGKTTLISMLTGLFPPSKGNAFVNNFSVVGDIDSVRKSLGICPQHDVLFDKLTVEEHLIFFARLKGCKGPTVQAEVNQMLRALQFEQFRYRQACMLSGGMKRKLSVGIALIGGSKVVMLDEPTSGMDPSARRATWDLIQQFKAGRTILLTTHFMDEADLLGDRIAIMSDGQLKCCGSSLFLKSRYGVGYHMVMVREPHCQVDAVVEFVQKYIPEARVESTSGAELSFILPKESSSQFEAAFTELEVRQKELGISSYGVSVTTMEEVFIKVGENANSLVQNGEGLGNRGNVVDDSSEDSTTLSNGYGSTAGQLKNRWRGKRYQAVTNDDTADLVRDGSPRRSLTPDMLNKGTTLLWQQFYALFVKRILHTRRNKAGAFTQLFWPGLFTLLGLIAAKTLPAPGDSPALVLDTSHYGANEVLFASLGERATAFATGFMRQFEGTRSAARDLSGTFNSTGKEFYFAFGNELLMETNSSGQSSIATFNKRHLVAASFHENDGSDVNITAYFNNKGYHAITEALHAVDNGLMKMYRPQQSIETVNHPLPRSTEQAADDLTKNGVGFALSFDVLFGMAFLASSFVRLVVQERESKAKHVQFVSGVHPISYWASAFSWDMVNYFAPTIMLLILFAAFDVPAYTTDGHLGYVLTTLLLYGWAVIPLMYLASFLFNSPARAFIVLTLFNIITGEIAIIVIFILSLLNLPTTANVLKYVFLIMPNFCLGQSLGDLYNNYNALRLCETRAKTCEELDVEWVEDYLSFSSPGIGRYWLAMAVQGMLFFLLVLLMESDVATAARDMLARSGPSDTESLVEGEDIDVATEQQRLRELANGQPQSAKSDHDVIVIRNLRKTYNSISCRKANRTVHAVRGISVGIQTSECFGLLGVNGAGKTTTFGMLTGDLGVSDGEAFMDGFSILTDMNTVRQRIGYCPQVDGLVDLLTGRELLTMFARLRGVPEKLIPGSVNGLISDLLLTEHADKPCGTYSGGNKRKLCTAIALVGDPPIVFLDEPTTGMDPVARRQLWQALCREREEGCCIVITSHSMEECEALCTRLAIMVGGRFRCLGSPQHLKNRFGCGYTLTVRLADVARIAHFKEFIVGTFGDCYLKEEHFGTICYQVNNTNLPTLFGKIEAHKDEFAIEDYAVTQTTLEQVFLSFARSDILENSAVDSWQPRSL